MVITSKRYNAPSSGKMLGDYAEGDIVLLNESGSPVEFYVAKHDYESGLNGTGRTLLVRKDCYNKRAWHGSNVNAYASSAIDSFLNGDYLALLDTAVQDAVDTTTFYYTPGNGTKTVTTLTRSVFLLSATELGLTATYANTEGTALGIASTLQIAYANGSAFYQWTRSPCPSSTEYVCTVLSSGKIGQATPGFSYGARPVFTLPSTASFDLDTNQFKGVA